VSERTQLSRALPEALDQLVGLNRILTRTAAEEGLDAGVPHLVEIRASQINGCAPCVDMHSHAAVRRGEAQRRLALLPVWRETDLFTEQERAALTLTEAMTKLPGTREVPDDVYDRAAKVFTERQLAVVVWIAAEIQAFNRLNVTSRAPLPEGDW
jgi:AhpD family alkylhydroperoxidase